MDVTKIIAELRSEWEDIEREILALERLDRLSAGTMEATAQSVIEIRRVKEPDEGWQWVSPGVANKNKRANF
jgi:hypothetical protein